MEGFGAKDQDIAGAQHHISPGDQDLILPLDGGDNDPVREMELMDGVVYPFVLLGERKTDEMYIAFLAVFADTLDPGILVDESGGYNTGRDGDHTHTQKCNKDAKHFPESGYWINVPVSYGQQGRGGPPDSGKGILEYFGLCFVFQAVHAETGAEHQHQDDKDGGHQLLFLPCNDFSDHVQRIIIGVDPEQAEDPDDPEHPECNGT